jgi:hypothetical protein
MFLIILKFLHFVALISSLPLENENDPELTDGFIEGDMILNPEQKKELYSKCKSFLEMNFSSLVHTLIF